MDNRSLIDNQSMKNIDKNSVLCILQTSVDDLHSLRKSRSPMPSRLLTCQSTMNSLKDKPINNSKDDLKSFHLSIASNSTVKRNYRSGKLLNQEKIASSLLNSRNVSSEKMPSKSQRINNFSNHFNKQILAKKIIFIEDNNKKKINKDIDCNYIEKRSKNIQFLKENQQIEKSNEKNIGKSVEKNIEKNIEKNREIFEKTKNDIQVLNENKIILERKIRNIKENLCKVSSMHVEEQTAMLSIVNKLDRLEDLANQQNLERKNWKIPSVIEKVSRLEDNCTSIISYNESSFNNFKEQIGEINNKLQDLKECNNILQELVATLQKEPLIDKKILKNVETSTEIMRYEKIETISLLKISDPEEILKDLYEKKNQLLIEKEKMENEYKSIPKNSKSMSNKRRRQILELDLSINYSKLIEISNKIKKYTN